MNDEAGHIYGLVSVGIGFGVGVEGAHPVHQGTFFWWDGVEERLGFDAGVGEAFTDAALESGFTGEDGGGNDKTEDRCSQEKTRPQAGGEEGDVLHGVDWALAATDETFGPENAENDKANPRDKNEEIVVGVDQQLQLTGEAKFDHQ